MLIVDYTPSQSFEGQGGIGDLFANRAHVRFSGWLILTSMSATNFVRRVAGTLNSFRTVPLAALSNGVLRFRPSDENPVILPRRLEREDK